MLRTFAYTLFLIFLIIGGIALGPGIPGQYNPLAPFDPAEPAGYFTQYKLAKAVKTPEQCFAVLEQIPDIRYAKLLDRRESAECGIEGHAKLRALSSAYVVPVSTSCQIALRLYMWERDTVQPAARRYLGTGVSEIDHLESYACRRMNTVEGPGDLMSAHATASAIDISGVLLSNGRRLTLEEGWRADDVAIRRFWRALRTGACSWFRTVLSPDFNRLHADHFHLAEGQFGACR